MLNNNNTKYDYRIWLLASLIVLLSGILLLINQLTRAYPIVNFPYSFYHNTTMLSGLVIYGVGFYLVGKHTRAALVCKTLGLVSLTALTMLIADSGFYTTPYRRQDLAVMHIDHGLGFYLIPFINHLAQYPWLLHFLDFIYQLLFLAIIVIPLLLALLKRECAVYRYFFACLVACLIGYSIFYFFPTSDPASVMHSRHFPLMAYYVAKQFEIVHQHHMLTYYRAGYIGLPSFHTIWALLLVFASYRVRGLFQLMIIFSSLVILSTLSTGWHFILDDIVAALVASLAWLAAVMLIKNKV